MLHFRQGGLRIEADCSTDEHPSRNNLRTGSGSLCGCFPRRCRISRRSGPAREPEALRARWTLH
eukprot:7329672-Alexandrium_andersonii.AAC.1